MAVADKPEAPDNARSRIRRKATLPLRMESDTPARSTAVQVGEARPRSVADARRPVAQEVLNPAAAGGVKSAA